MRAIRVAQFGASDVLKLTDCSLPKVKRDELLVKVKAIGVNPVDTYIRNGTYSTKPELPYTPGSDLSGEIVEIGSQELEKQFHIGQRIFANGTTSGSYAEYSVVPAKNCFSLHDKLSYSQGAAIGVPYGTAYRALFIKSKPQQGDIVLVHGASGAVGLAAVQLAHAKGFQVYGTAGTDIGVNLVKQHGADKVFNHRNDNYIKDIMSNTGGKGVNIILEMLANVNLTNDCLMCANGGKILVIGCRGSLDFNPRLTMKNELSITGVALRNANAIEYEEQMKGITDAIADGVINPFIGKEFPLMSAADAHDYIINNSGTQGKVVLTTE